MSFDDVNLNEELKSDGSKLMKKDVMLGYNNNILQFGAANDSMLTETDPDKYVIPTDSSSSSDDTDSTSDEEWDAKPLLQPKFKVLTIKNGKDVDQIPISKEGMAVCEKCGTIGVKHAFYSKSKRFCSLECSRTYFDLQKEGRPIPKPKPVFKFPMANLKIKKKSPKKQSTSASAKPTLTNIDSNNSFTWISYLRDKYFKAVPVSSFKHAPLSDCWDNVMVGMKVEVENRDDEDFRKIYPHTYWVASVVAVAGYKALLRYEGFGVDNREDFWLNLCKQHVQPVGWCASQGKPLIPPRSIQHKVQDWKQFLVKRLTGARTLPADFHQRVSESIVSKFKPGMQLEVVDKNCISTVCVAYVQEVIGGRLHVRYQGSESWDDGFWCHEKSPLIHPLGWSQQVGHNVNMSPDYSRIANQRALTRQYSENEASWEMFHHMDGNSSNSMRFREGMKLEAIDPLNLSAICVATITKVLRKGYLMIGIDGYNERGSDWFCHHSTSGSVFPVGFCGLNKIQLTPPKEYRGEFKWEDYLRATKSSAAPVAAFNQDFTKHNFEVGMHLEAVDLMEPGLICVGTVTKVVGRLLRIHFDGWEVSYDQWCDYESPDLYPVGWCELVGYHLESPKVNEQEKKRKIKTSYKGVRKKKRVRLLSSTFGKQKHSTNTSKDETKSHLVQNMRVATDLPPQQERVIGLNSSRVSEEVLNSSELHLSGKLSSAAVNETDINLTKTIPRLIDNLSSNLTLTSHQSVITPELWSVFDVSQFLRINDCAAHCESFSKKKIDGRKFLTLTKEQTMNLTGMKVGPSLKIYDLIQQLKGHVH